MIKTDYIIVDHVPDLPKLQASSRNGCDLCCLIHNALLSEDTDYAMKKICGKQISHLESSAISISMTYIWNHISGSRSSGLDGAYVEILFDELKVMLHMTLLAEAVPGSGILITLKRTVID